MMEEAERSYEAGDLDSALMVYLLMAEMGLEVAQTNAAYVLEQGVCLYLGQAYSKWYTYIQWEEQCLGLNVGIGEFLKGTGIYRYIGAQYRFLHLSTAIMLCLQRVSL